MAPRQGVARPVGKRGKPLAGRPRIVPSLPAVLRPTIPTSCRRALRWDSISAVLSGISSGAVSPFFGVIARQDMHASNFLLAVLSSSGSAANLFNPLVAHHIRKKPKLPYVLWPAALARLVYFFVPFALAAPLFIIIGLAGNFIITLSGPASAAVTRDAYPARRRGRLMGFVRVLAVLGGLVGTALGGRLLMHHDYKLIFPLMMLVGLASVLAFSRLGVGTAPEEDARPHMSLREMFAIVRQDKTFRLYCTFFYLYGFGNTIAGPDHDHGASGSIAYHDPVGVLSRHRQPSLERARLLLLGAGRGSQRPVPYDVRRARRPHPLPPHLLLRP